MWWSRSEVKTNGLISKKQLLKALQFFGSWVFSKTTPFFTTRRLIFLFNEKNLHKPFAPRSPLQVQSRCWCFRPMSWVNRSFFDIMDVGMKWRWKTPRLTKESRTKSGRIWTFFFDSYFFCVGEVEVGRCFSCETEFWRGEVWNLDAIKGSTHFIQWIERVMMQESSCKPS